jgi:hypothetical protein
MTKRLQVILQDAEYKAVRRAARARHMTIAAWVRQALELQRREEPDDSVERKLAAIRVAAKYEFPAPEIDQMLEEIEKGYLSGPEP